jgi:Tfp pilus assembly protein PilV
MTMKQALALFAAVAVLVGVTAAPQVSAAPLHHTPALSTAKRCSTTWEVTGRKVAVRRPAWNDGPVATTTSPIHHYLYRGDRVTSCTVAVARTESGPAYRKCGKAGSLWRIVPGGQVPQTCLKRA